MSNSRTLIPSPARSQGAPRTPRRYVTPRKTRSVCSPARSTSGRLSALIQEHREQDSFRLSPIVRRSLLPDDTDIDMPGRKSWWKNLNDQSRDVTEVLKENVIEPHNIMDELNIEVLSQETQKCYTLDLPDSSDCESIHSIVMPHKRLFDQKENRPQKQYDDFGSRGTLEKVFESNTNHEKSASPATKELFQNKPTAKPAFPAALLDVSANTTVGDKTLAPAVKPRTGIRNMFGAQQSTKRKNMFAKFIESTTDYSSEEEIADVSKVQRRFFDLPKPAPQRRVSAQSSSSKLRDPSPASNDMADSFADWDQLPSSTMVDNQLEAALTGGSTAKRSRLSKLSEASSPLTNNSSKSSNKSKQSNKSFKNKSQIKNKSLEKTLVAQKNASLTLRSKEINRSKSDKNIQITDINVIQEPMEKSEKNNDYNSVCNKEKAILDNIEMETNCKQPEEQETLETAVKDNNITKQILNKSSDKSSKKIEDSAAISRKSNVIDIAMEKLDEIINQDDDMEILVSQDESINKQQEENHECPNDNVSGLVNKEQGSEHKHQNISDGNSFSRKNDNIEDEHSTKHSEMDITIDKQQIENKQNNKQNIETLAQNEISIDNSKIHSNDAKEQMQNMATQNNLQNLQNESQQNRNESQLEKTDIETNKSLKQTKVVEENTEMRIEPVIDNQEIEKENSDQEKDDNESETEEQEVEKIEEAAVDENDSETEEQEIENNMSGIEEQEVAEDESEIDEQEVDKHVSYTEEQEVEEIEEAAVDENDSETEEQEIENNMSNEEQEVDEDESEIDEQEVDKHVSETEGQEVETNESDTEEQDVENESVEEQTVEGNESVTEEQEADENESEVEEENDEINVGDQDNENDNQDIENASEQEITPDASNQSIEAMVDSDTENDQESEGDQINESKPESENEETNISEPGYEEVEVNESDDEQANESEHESEAEQANESGQDMETDQNDDEAIDDTPDISHDTTGRNRKKPEDVSIEAVVFNPTKELEHSFVGRARNTTVKMTKSFINPHIERARIEENNTRGSLSMSEGRNSSAEGSGWDSHRTTRKTLRQTFGKDITPRKSLRALVMENAAKRHTLAKGSKDTMTGHIPLANSTELGEASMGNDYEMQDEPVESVQEVSIRTRKATLEDYLIKIKRENDEKRAKIAEAVKNQLEQAPKEHTFKVPARPTFPRRTQTKPQGQAKAATNKKLKLSVPLEDLPADVQEDLKYKPPKRFAPRNAAWLTMRFYKFIENKLEPKYDYKARVRAEKFAQKLYNFVQANRRRNVALSDHVEELKHEMARLKIVKTHIDFYNFFWNFMPREVRLKVIPDLINKIPQPRSGVFSDILVSDMRE